jgi:hypothetical protein
MDFKQKTFLFRTLRSYTLSGIELLFSYYLIPKGYNIIKILIFVP